MQLSLNSIHGFTFFAFVGCAGGRKMDKLWLTYAWIDNEQADVDHVIGELRRAGLDVHYDRRQIIPGQRIWPQIDAAISDPAQVDGWAIFATKHSLQSEPCKEELAYAHDRALRKRGGDFPLIGIFPEPIDRELVPSALITRLYVTLQDPNWAKLIVDGVRRKRTELSDNNVRPFILRWHPPFEGDLQLELRPRSGRWYPCFVTLLNEERSRLKFVVQGPAGLPPSAAMTSEVGVASVDGLWSGIEINHSIDNLNSAYAVFTSPPSQLRFGSKEDAFISEIVPPRTP
jgi:hypothetical protein